MRLDTFLLADAVATPPDGKLYVQGGGITRFNVPTLPYVLPQLGVLVRLRLDDASELSEPHRIEVNITDPDGVFVVPPGALESVPTGPAPGVAPDEETFMLLAFHIGGISFGRTGTHQFQLVVDAEVLRTIPLPVVAVSAEELSAARAHPVTPTQPGAPNRAARRAKPSRRP